MFPKYLFLQYKSKGKACETFILLIVLNYHLYIYRMVLLESLKVPLGTEASSFTLRGIDGEIHTVEMYKDTKVLVIAFICNHCPYVQAVWTRLVALSEKYIDNVQFLAINSNVNHPDYPDESPEKMKDYAQKYNMKFPYLMDESQEVAKAYKAQCTPDIFVFDSERKLAYHGRIDDNWKEPDKVKYNELDMALDALKNGRKPSENQHPSMGCSLKWH